MKTSLITAVVLTLIFITVCTVCFADISEDARKIVSKYENAIVTVQMVIEITSSYEGSSDKHENKLSATATIIDPSGLAVTSLTAVNPADMFQDMMQRDDSDFSYSTKIIDVKIKLSDGTEIPADVVLRDRDLDLAFIKPKKAPDKPFEYVDMTQSGTPQMLDEIVVLSRLGQVGNRSLAASIDRVHAIVTKPRKFYVMRGQMFSGVGYPAFTLDGKPAGILVMRISQVRDSEGMSGMADKMLEVVFPCPSMLTAIDQAIKAVPEKVAVSPVKDTTKAEAKPTLKPAPKPATKPAKKPTAK